MKPVKDNFVRMKRRIPKEGGWEKNKKLRAEYESDLYFFELPPELTSIIFANLELKDLASLTTVCKQWEKIWYHIEQMVVADTASLRLLNNVGKCRALRSLKILSNKHLEISMKRDLTFLENLQHLQELVLDGGCNFFRKLDLCSSLRALTRLRYLTIKQASFKAWNAFDFCTNFKHLEFLRLEDLNNESNEYVSLADMRTLGSLTSLQHLVLLIIPLESARELAFLSMLTKLHTLHIYDIDLVGNWGNYISELTCMTSLTMKNPLQYIQPLHNIAKLGSCIVSNIDDCKVLFGMSKLQELQVDSRSPMEDNFVAGLPQLTQLTSLHAYFHIMPHQLSSLTNLVHLYIALNKIEEDDWQILCNLTNLQKLSLMRAVPPEQFLLHLTSLQKLHSLRIFWNGPIPDTVKRVLPCIVNSQWSIKL